MHKRDNARPDALEDRDAGGQEDDEKYDVDEILLDDTENSVDNEHNDDDRNNRLECCRKIVQKLDV